MCPLRASCLFPGSNVHLGENRCWGNSCFQLHGYICVERSTYCCYMTWGYLGCIVARITATWYLFFTSSIRDCVYVCKSILPRIGPSTNWRHSQSRPKVELFGPGTNSCVPMCTLSSRQLSEGESYGAYFHEISRPLVQGFHCYKFPSLIPVQAAVCSDGLGNQRYSMGPIRSAPRKQIGQSGTGLWGLRVTWRSFDGGTR